MLLFLVHLLFLSLFYNVAGINLTYIVRKDKSGFYPSCVAEELERYAGIGWIYPIPKDTRQGLPTIANKYIPTIENDFNCKFSANNHCNTIWSLKDWYIDETSPETKEFITDTRWEDFPTILISNSLNEFQEKIELENSFKSTFSVRADGEVEIIVSEGTNPYSAPCYYLNIGYREIYFKKYSALPRGIKDDFKNNFIDNYKAYSNILSSDEWRSFSWSMDVTTGLAKLIDINLNRTLIERTLTEPLFSKYMYMRSANSSLWKIHQNSFLFTNTSQISRLGPQLFLPNKDLCLSMFVKTCKDCYMSFFYLNTTRKILKTVGPTKNEEWIEVKLKEENTQYDKLNLFVETLMISNSSISKFWAIDNVRVCHESEVKVSYLKFQKIEENIHDGNITCQLVKNPTWKPKKLIFDNSTDFPKISITPTTNSIRLTWPQTEETDSIHYFILYEGNDRCLSEHHNLLRLKSNGFVSTKNNRIILTDLIPYTFYNLTISSILQENDKKFFVETPETVEPRLEELPSNIKLKPLDTSIHVSWDSVDCSKQYGRLAYTVIVFNSTLNFSKEIAIQTNSSYTITDLIPFTHYSLTILTARNGRYLYNKIHTNNFTLNFMTMPGVPPAPENLELYSMDKNSASLRYDLPSNSHGITREVQVIRCNSLSFKKCKSSISIVKRCSMWPKKYCVDAHYLIPLQSYNIKVSLKNLNTPSFGNEAIVEGKAEDRIPGKPTNITYKFVECPLNTEYCHLNITWLHPYYQNGTITSFEIILNGTDKRKDAENDKYIHEVYNVENKTYYYDYTYQIKYLPYNSYYNLYLSSANSAFKSEFAEIQIKTDNIGDHIDQSPKLIAKSHSTLLFKIPHLDSRLQFFTLTVVVQDYDKARKIDKELLKNKKIADNLCHPYGDAWISQVVKVDSSNKTENVMIGNAEKERLQPNKKYCIIFIITNQYKGSEHDVVYYERLKMMDAEPQQKEATSGSVSNHLYMLLFILLVIPVGFLLYRYLRKKRLLKKAMQTNDHVYETLPCEEIDNSNRMNGRMLQAE